MILLHASDFALPQRRVRLFILGINRERAAKELQTPPKDVLNMALGTYLPMFKCDALPVAALFEANKHMLLEELVGSFFNFRQLTYSSNYRFFIFPVALPRQERKHN